MAYRQILLGFEMKLLFYWHLQYLLILMQQLILV